MQDELIASSRSGISDSLISRSENACSVGNIDIFAIRNRLAANENPTPVEGYILTYIWADHFAT
jgi:hypothetical protein